MGKRLCIVILFVILRFSSSSQVIGSKLPNFSVDNVLNYKTSTVNLSDFKGKLLILDFWASWCEPCVASLPKIDSLQREFKDSIQFLLVTQEDKKKVRLLIDKLAAIKKIVPPLIITKDSVLNSLFIHTEIPHYVWIDSKGTIIGITGRGDVTRENIKDVLRNKIEGLSEKKERTYFADINKQFIYQSSLVVEGKEEKLKAIDDSDVLFHSVITKNRFGLKGFTHQEPTRITAVNQTVQKLYMTAVGKMKWEFLMPSRVLIETEDSADYYRFTGFQFNGKRNVDKEWRAWAKLNTFCYELKVPASCPPAMRWEIMAKDLNQFFGALYGIEGKIEKRKMKCLTLVRTSNEDKIYSNGGTKKVESNFYYLHISNGFLKDFLQAIRMNNQLSEFPILDCTNYAGMINLELNCKLSSLEDVNNALSKYDLKFIISEIPTDMIVIKRISVPKNFTKN